MAYAFDKVQDLLNPNKGFALADEQGQGQSAGLSSNTGGDIAPPTGGSGSATTAYEAQPSTSAASRGVLSKNKGQAQSPIDIGALDTSIGQARQTLKGEADKYVANAANPYLDWIDEIGSPNANLKTGVKNYVEKGSTKQNPGFEPYPGNPSTSYDLNANVKEEPKDWYQLSTSAPLDPGVFKPTTSTDFRGVSDLQSGAGGIRNLFQRSGSARYTPGMASMDTSLLLQDPNYATAAENVTKGVGSLKGYEAELLDKAPKAAKNVSTNYQSSLNDAIKLAAWGEEGGLKQSQIDEASSPQAFTDFTTQSDVIRGQLIADNPEWKPFIESLGQEGFNDLIRKATKSGQRGSTNWEDYIDEDEAGKFNRVQELLGSGKTYVKGNRGGKDSELDMESLRGMLKSGSSGYKPPIVDNLPPSAQSGSSGGASGVPTRVGSPEAQPGSPNEITVDVPGVGPTTITLPYKPPTKEDAERMVRDALMPTIPMNEQLFKDVKIPEDTWQGKIISGAKGLAGGPGGSVAMSAPPSSVSFPNVQDLLGGGGGSSYNGDPANMEGLLNMGLPAGGTPTYSAPAPVVPNTPTINFGGGYGSENAGTADKQKQREKTQAEKDAEFNAEAERRQKERDKKRFPFR